MAKVGIMIEGQEGLNWDRWRLICHDAEALGVESLRRSDHRFSVMVVLERDCIECWTSLALAAEWTKTIELGPMVSPLTFRPPALLARMATAVDLLAGGRLILGVGAGWYEREHVENGIPFLTMGGRMDLLEEGIKTIRATGIATIIVDKNFAAVSSITDRTILLVKGQFAFDGTTRDLLVQPARPPRSPGI